MLMNVVILAAIVSGILSLLLTKRSEIKAKIDEHTNKKILYYNSVHRILGVVIGFELPLILFFFLYPLLDFIGILIFTPFTIMAIYFGIRMIIESYFYRLELEKDKITEKYLFGRSKLIMWNDIEKLVYEERVLKIRGKNGIIIKINHWIVGFPTLLEEIKINVPSRIFEPLVKL